MPAPTRSALLAAALFALAGSGAEAQTPASRWLDAKPLANWNKAGAAIPRGPKSEYAEDIKECERRGAGGTAKSAPTPETRQVAAAGWLGVTVERRAGDAVYVFARNGVDGMCRPMAYQIFVFVGGRFAGTLAPRPMDSRTDGSGYLEPKPQARRFTAEFARYRRDDPLCCPSRSSKVTYAIRSAPDGGALVVPVRVATKANRR